MSRGPEGTPTLADDGLLETFDRLADEVRPPALTLDLFTSEPLNDADDGVEDERADEAIGAALDPAALQAAPRRRGGLMFAANLVFDHILDDLVVSDEDRARPGVERFADEYLPSRLRHHYDSGFLRKFLATAAKVAQDLANEEFTYPSWTALSEYLFEDLDFEYLFDADMDGVEDDPLAHKTSGIDVRPLADWSAPFNIGARVHPYAVELHGRGQPVLFDLARTDEGADHLTSGLAD